MSKYNRKKENPASVAAQTDEFVGFWQRTGESVRPYVRGIAFVVAGFVVVLGVGGVVMSWHEHRAEGATEAWGRAVRMYANELEGDPSIKEDKGDEVDKLPRFKTAKERGEATLAAIDKLPTALRKEAQLFRAGVLYDLERWDDARAAYDQATVGVPPEIAVVAREGVALCDEQANKLDAAISDYAKVAPKGDKASEFYRDHALMGLGRLYEKKGDKPKALEQYKELVAAVGTSSLREDAQNRIAVLEAL